MDALVTAANNYYDKTLPSSARKDIERDLVSLRGNPILAIHSCATALTSSALTPSASVLVLSILHYALSGGWIHAVDESVHKVLFEQLMSLALPPIGSSVSAAVSSMAAKALALVIIDTADTTFAYTWSSMMAALHANDATTTYALRLLQEMLSTWFPDHTNKEHITTTTIAASDKTRTELKEAIITQLQSLFEVLGELLTQRSRVIATSPHRAATFDRAITEPLLGALEQLVTAIPHPAYASTEFLMCFQELAGCALASDDVQAATGCQALSVVTAIINRQLIANDAVETISNLSCLLIKLLVTACGGTIPSNEVFEYSLPENSADTVTVLDDATHTFLLDFMKAWFKHVLPKAEVLSGFPLLKAFELLFVFTIAEDDSDRFVECISVWMPVCDRIAELVDVADGREDLVEILRQYESIFVALAEQLLTKLQFRTNKALEHMRDEQSPSGSCSEESEGLFAFKLDKDGDTAGRSRLPSSTPVLIRAGLPSEPYHVDMDDPHASDWMDEEYTELQALRHRTPLSEHADNAGDGTASLDFSADTKARSAFLRQCIMLMQAICRIPGVLDKVLAAAGELLVNNVTEVVQTCQAVEGGVLRETPSLALALQDSSTFMTLLTFVTPAALTSPSAASAHDGLLTLIEQLAQEAAGRSWHLRGGKFCQLLCRIFHAFSSRLSAINARISRADASSSDLEDTLRILDVVLSTALVMLDSAIIPPIAELSHAGANLFSALCQQDALRTLLRSPIHRLPIFGALVAADTTRFDIHRIIAGLRPYHQSTIVASVVRLLLLPAFPGGRDSDVSAADRASIALSFLQTYTNTLISCYQRSTEGVPLVLNERSSALRSARNLGILTGLAKAISQDPVAVKSAVFPALQQIVDAGMSILPDITSAPPAGRGNTPPLSIGADVVHCAAKVLASCRSVFSDAVTTTWLSVVLPILRDFCAAHAADAKPVGYVTFLVSGLRFLRSCALTAPKGMSSSTDSAEAIRHIRNAVADFLCSEGKAASHPGTSVADEIAPATIALCRDFIRESWTALTVRTASGGREFTSPETHNVVAVALDCIHVWLTNAFGSAEVYRLALYSIAALDRDCSVLAAMAAWTAADGSNFLHALQVTLLDSIVNGDRASMVDEIVTFLVYSARYNEEAFLSSLLPAWQASRMHSLTAEAGDNNFEDAAVKGICARVTTLLRDKR